MTNLAVVIAEPDGAQESALSIIVEVMTCSADVDTVLRQIFPEPEGLDGLHGH
jgi:hypothetical protein